MKEQLDYGAGLDWSREIATCHPQYYRHEQKMFRFSDAGLAYQKESMVNWDRLKIRFWLMNRWLMARVGVQAHRLSETEPMVFKDYRFCRRFVRRLKIARQLADKVRLMRQVRD